MIEFKVVYGQSLAVVMNCLDKFFQKYLFRISRILFFLFPVHVRDLLLYDGDGKTAGGNDAGKSELCVYVDL